MVEKIHNMSKEYTIKHESKTVNNNADELDFIRHKLENFQASIVKDLKNRIGAEVEDVMQELRQRKLQSKEFQCFAKANTWYNRISHAQKQSADESSDATEDAESSEGIKNVNCRKSKNPLPYKIFCNRESYLTALLQVDHMRSIYHIFYTIFILVFFHSVAHDYFVDGSINFGLGTMKIGFAGMHFVLLIWLVQNIFAFLTYFAFGTWMNVRIKLERQKSLQRFWSHSCLIMYIASQIVFAYTASAFCLRLNLPFASTSVLLLETIRLLMKMHAFVRTNVGLAVASKLKCDADINETIKESTFLAPFTWYVYFLFSPTLIYRSNYPRTTTIRWSYAFRVFLEGVAIAFLISYMHERHMRPHFINMGREPMTVGDFIVKLNAMLVPSTIIFLCGFYLLLHAWLNFTSEVLRFGDRMFYMDWWTSSSYSAYYRKWNVVVHDWLYEYIYKDCYNNLFHNSKVASSIMVFTISALAHELVLGFAMHLFFPVMFVLFAIVGVFFVFTTEKLSKNAGNIFLWFSLIFGNGVMFTLYYMEFYTLQNCKFTNNDFIDHLIPAVWKCKI